MLPPFLEEVYSDGHTLMDDNDPKHTSNTAKKFLEDNQVN